MAPPARPAAAGSDRETSHHQGSARRRRLAPGPRRRYAKTRGSSPPGRPRSRAGSRPARSERWRFEPLPRVPGGRATPRPQGPTPASSWSRSFRPTDGSAGDVKADEGGRWEWKTGAEAKPRPGVPTGRHGPDNQQQAETDQGLDAGRPAASDERGQRPPGGIARYDRRVVGGVEAQRRDRAGRGQHQRPWRRCDAEHGQTPEQVLNAEVDGGESEEAEDRAQDEQGPPAMEQERGRDGKRDDRHPGGGRKEAEGLTTDSEDAVRGQVAPPEIGRAGVVEHVLEHLDPEPEDGDEDRHRGQERDAAQEGHQDPPAARGREDEIGQEEDRKALERDCDAQEQSGGNLGTFLLGPAHDDGEEDEEHHQRVELAMAGADEAGQRIEREESDR